MRTSLFSPMRYVVGVLLFAILWPGFIYSQEVPITTSSKEAKNLFIKGREKSENSQGAVAAGFYDKAIALDPNFAMAYIYRSQSGGGFNVSRQNRDKAVSLVDKVSPGERLWILATQASAEANRIACREHLEELIRLYPNDKRVLSFMGFFFQGEQDYKKALLYCSKSLEIDKNFTPVLNQLGYIHMLLGNWVDAETSFMRQISLIPNMPNPYDSYAEMLLRKGQYDEAIKIVASGVST